MKNLNLLSVFASILITSNLFATVDVGAPINVENEVQEWQEEFAKKFNGKKSPTECRETKEIPGTFLCQSYTQNDMNLALTRASFFIEGNGGQSEVVVPTTDRQFQRYLRLIGGHDLQGKDLLKYYAAAKEACDKDKKMCPDPLETELFENFIVPKAQANPDFIIITFALHSGLNWRLVVTHEILHAEYFSNEKYRQVIDDFWHNTMSENQRDAIRQNLAQNYDAKNELLMKNEFQAYILMAGAERSELGEFVETYRQPLLDRLNKVGIKPIQVK